MAEDKKGPMEKTGGAGAASGRADGAGASFYGIASDGAGSRRIPIQKGAGAAGGLGSSDPFAAAAINPQGSAGGPNPAPGSSGSSTNGSSKK